MLQQMQICYNVSKMCKIFMLLIKSFKFLFLPLLSHSALFLTSVKQQIDKMNRKKHFLAKILPKTFFYTLPRFFQFLLPFNKNKTISHQNSKFKIGILTATSLLTILFSFINSTHLLHHLHHIFVFNNFPVKASKALIQC